MQSVREKKFSFEERVLSFLRKIPQNFGSSACRRESDTQEKSKI
jgi:hypothetical protein